VFHTSFCARLQILVGSRAPVIWTFLLNDWWEANGSWNALTLAKGISPCRDQLGFQQQGHAE
jgi:hypothetical protein